MKLALDKKKYENIKKIFKKILKKIKKVAREST